MERPTVLIVDDEPRVLDALEAILAAEFPVVRASHGDEALAVLERQEVAVILTDHRMPGMTGVELLRRSQDIAPHAIRIVLTAFTDVDNLMEAINTGRIYHFIPKPWDPNAKTHVSGTSSSWRATRCSAKPPRRASGPCRSRSSSGHSRGCGAPSSWRGGSSRATPRCSCSARPVPARSCSRA